MSEHEPIDPALADLFRDAASPAPSHAARERVRTRLATAIPAMASGAPPGEGAPGHGGPAAAGAHVVTRAMAIFVVGAIAGGGAVALLRPVAAPRIVYVTAPAPPSPSPTASDPSAAPSITVPPLVLASASSHRPARSDPPPLASHNLADERLLLDDARTRLGNGDADGALTKLDEHARRFPNGHLDEEREALAIQALVSTHRYDEARARAAAFSARSPNSVFSNVIETSLRSIP